MEEAPDDSGPLLSCEIKSNWPLPATARSRDGKLTSLYPG